MSYHHPRPMDDVPCLLYPENAGIHDTVTIEQAMTMLSRAIQVSQQTPYSWSYIDKPPDGQMYLLYQTSPTFPADGLRYLYPETHMMMPLAVNREMDIWEVKGGFIPDSGEVVATRVRRRYRLRQGGAQELILVHYSRVPPEAGEPIPPHLMHQPVRNYPLQPIMEPPVFVLGERKGVKVLPHAPPGSHMPHPPPPHQQQPPPPYPGAPMNPQAMLAQQNAMMDRHNRERRGMPPVDNRGPNMGERIPQPRQIPLPDDDSGDELETISTRTLAQSRYQRNHEFMNDVFVQAAFGKQINTASTPSSAFSIFNEADMEEKIAKLNSEIEELKSAASQRAAKRAEVEKAQSALSTSMDDVTMTELSESAAPDAGIVIV